MSVLPPSERRSKKRLWLTLLTLGVVLIALVGYIVWEKFFHEIPQQFASLEDAFLYGSIGVEEEQGIPYWVWAVLPRVFPEYLPGPGGYASLGFAWEPGQEMPVGFSKRRIGYERVAINCAMCHSATYRVRRSDGRPSQTVVVPTGPANRLDPQGYLNFLSQCAQDPRFNADTLLAAIEYNLKMSWLDRKIYRHLIIPGTRKALREQTASGQWMSARPPWGHGRIDPFNPVKFRMLGMRPEKDDTVGNSDMMPLWELEKRRSRTGNYHLHWDGLSTSPLDITIAGALGDGATPKSLPVERMGEIAEWLATYRPTKRHDNAAAPNDLLKYPLGHEDRLARLGSDVFTKHCAECHAVGSGPRTNTIIRLDEIGTDPNRLLMWNASRDPPLAFQRYNDFGNRYAWDLNSFVRTVGYVSPPLNGIWLRAPYLHNGSVPTLDDLLNPPLSDEHVANLLTVTQPGSFERLNRMFSRAEPLSAPIEHVAAELEGLKPLVDRVIEEAERMGHRPPLFYRGYDVLDPKRVGFIHTSEAAQGRRLPIPFVTFIQGNSNSGHLYGIELPDEEKRALVEFLKTL